VMVSCHVDRVLIRLAREFNFPRGFPLLWRPGRSVQSFGFYPKFENDARCAPLEGDSEFADVREIRFFRKWSGFLGQVCAFSIDGSNYWMACSKNSAGGFARLPSTFELNSFVASSVTCQKRFLRSCTHTMKILVLTSFGIVPACSIPS